MTVSLSGRGFDSSADASERRVAAVHWGGRRFDLHADRAIHWRQAKTVIIADPHFGKAAAFRAGGVPVPHGTTRANLDRLSALLAHSRAQRLMVLGDFLHAAAGRADNTMNAIAAWRQRHADICIVLVRGNHDQNAGDPPPDWGFTCVDEPHHEDRFAFRHAPAAAACGLAAPRRAQHRFTFAGHVHPCAILRDIDGSSMRAACFHLSKTQLILPAFGEFTGTHPVTPRRGDRIFALNGECISEIPAVAPQ